MKVPCITLVCVLSLTACGEPATEPAPLTQQELVVAFTNIRVEDLGATRAVVRFDTDIPTSCEAEYGLAAGALDLRATDPDMAEGELTTEHEVPLEDLPPATEIFWRARAENEDGLPAFSEVSSFITLAADDAPQLTNYALGATVMNVSSNFGGGANDSNWGVDNALDGQMATEWATDGDGDSAMLQVDIGEVRTVTAIGFRSRKMTDGSSIITAFQLKFDGGEAVGPFEAPDPDEHYFFELDSPTQAQTVTLEAVTTTGGNTGVKELELLGN